MHSFFLQYINKLFNLDDLNTYKQEGMNEEGGRGRFN